MADQTTTPAMTFDAAPVKQDTPVSAPSNSSGMTFDATPVKQDTPASSIPDPMAGATTDERSFLKSNTNHAYVPADPKFPNRQPGIYPKSETGLNDPEMEHHPVDLNLGEHTVEGAAMGAAAVAPVLLPAAGAELAGAIKAGVTALTPAAVKGVQAVGEWAVAHPTTAKLLWEGLKIAMTGTIAGVAGKVAGKVINAAPDSPSE